GVPGRGEVDQAPRRGSRRRQRLTQPAGGAPGPESRNRRFRLACIDPPSTISRTLPMPIPMSRRDAPYSLGALFAVPFLRMPRIPVDPLEGSILGYQAGRASGAWTATEVVRLAIDRSYRYNRALHFTDLLADSALEEAAASDARARRGRLISPLGGVPVSAKSLHDVR